MLNQAEAGRSQRAQERREQILDAASACFARCGFHAATIQQISRVAGMSPGHIYHFFENKEAIVNGIVQRILDRWLNLMQPHTPGSDIDAVLAERVKFGLCERTNPDFVGLWLEVLAETARNPALAAAMQDNDQQMRNVVITQIRDLRAILGIETATPVESIADLVLALFEGLSNRSVTCAEFDPERLQPTLLELTRAAFAL